MSKSIRIILAFFLLKIAHGEDECPCNLNESDQYPGHNYRWNCEERGLVAVPGQCWQIQAENVTELWLTKNSIAEVRSIDLLDLEDLKVLRVDHNLLEFFDPTATDEMEDLEILHVGYESNDLDMNPLTLRYKPNLREAFFINSNVRELPTLTSSPLLQKLDIRSSGLTSLPRPLFSNLLPENDESFLFTMTDNNIVDVACDVFLPIPAGAVINVDDQVTLWCQDAVQKGDILVKDWKINQEIDGMTKICGEDGMPTDSTLCEAVMTINI